MLAPTRYGWINSLDPLRAGHIDYVINEARWTIYAGVPWLGRQSAALAVHQLARVVDHATRQTYLERFDHQDIAGHTRSNLYRRRRGTAGHHFGTWVAARQLVIVSHETGQFALGRHALCWVPAKRLQPMSEPKQPSILLIHRPTETRRTLFRWAVSLRLTTCRETHHRLTDVYQKTGGPRMNLQYEPDHELEDRLSRRLLDVFIRAGLVVVLVLLCYLIFSPFLTMMLWALILAITIYPLHQMLAARIGGKQGLAATLIVLLTVGVIVTPTIMLASEFGDSVQNLIKNVRDNTLQIPAPSEKVAAWPVVGERVHAVWSQAHNDLPGLVQSMQPKLGELAAKALGIVAALGGSLLMFLFSFVVAGIIMAYGESGAQAMQEIFERIAGIARGEEFTKLSTATVRAVASGVIGIACIQALIIGVSLMIAGVPFAGVLAVVVLVFGVAQLPALIVTLPVIGWIWASGEYGTGPAVAYTVLLFVGGMADNVLKPLMLGRGVDAPMPVILIGALGGMATTGILGMFVGATGLALGYQIFMRWVHDNPERARQTAAGGSPSTG